MVSTTNRTKTLLLAAALGCALAMDEQPELLRTESAVAPCWGPHPDGTTPGLWRELARGEAHPANWAADSSNLNSGRRFIKLPEDPSNATRRNAHVEPSDGQDRRDDSEGRDVARTEQRGLTVGQTALLLGALGVGALGGGIGLVNQIGQHRAAQQQIELCEAFVRQCEDADDLKAAVKAGEYNPGAYVECADTNTCDCWPMMKMITGDVYTYDHAAKTVTLQPRQDKWIRVKPNHQRRKPLGRKPAKETCKGHQSHR